MKQSELCKIIRMLLDAGVSQAKVVKIAEILVEE